MPSREEYDHLLAQVVEEISERQARLLFWGVSHLTLEVLAELRRLDLTGAVLGLADHRPQQIGRALAGWTVLDPAAAGQLEPDCLVVGLDAEKEEVLLAYASHGRTTPRVLTHGTAHYRFRDAAFDRLVRAGLVKSQAGGYPDILVHLYQVLRMIAARGLQGDVAEFGVYKGGTTTFLARCLLDLRLGSVIYGFDTFAGFPPRRSVLDAHDDPEDEYLDEAAVRAHCSIYENIRLVTGEISETCRVLEGHHLILTFFDTDNYTGTRAVLRLCAEITVPGGVIALDHYFSPQWPTTLGERLAAKEVLTGAAWFNLHGTGIFLKAG